jgi:hypothetical protein
MSELRCSLEPVPVPIVATAAYNQQYDDYDQKCQRIHDDLLCSRGYRPCKLLV